MNKLAWATAALLTTQWPNGTVQRTPCVDNYSCDLAARFDLDRGALQAGVIPDLTPHEAGFPDGWDCIQSYNCPQAKKEQTR